jgi:hypothetical protein
MKFLLRPRYRLWDRMKVLVPSRFLTKRCPLCGKVLSCETHGVKYMEFVGTEPEFAFCYKCSEEDPGYGAVKHLHYEWPEMRPECASFERCEAEG